MVSAAGYALPSEISQRARAVVLPPVAPRPHREFCHTLTIPDGPLRGSRYLPSADPVHDCLAAQITAGGWQRIVAVGAVQTGKSLATILVPILRNLTILRQPCVYSQPTLTKLQEGWAGKLQPSMRDSGYGGWLPEKGQGSKGSQTPKFITFRDPKTHARAGTLYLIPGGGASESAQSAVTAALVAVDEVDSFPSRHRVELILKRADSYGSKALRILTSTVKSDRADGDEQSIILSFYKESTQSRLHFECPHCHHWQPLEWERVTYDPADEPAAIASARYTCASCAVNWTEDDRQRALHSYRCVHRGQQIDQTTGSIIGDAPMTVAFGLLWTALDSSLRQMGQVAAEHWRASRLAALGDHGAMRSFVRDQLCRPYVEPEPEGEINSKTLHLASGASTYAKRIVPQWVRFLTMAQDVQGDRHYWIVIGHGPDERWCVIDWGYEYLAPREAGSEPSRAHTKADRMRVMSYLAQLAREGWQVEGGEERMRPVQCGIDCGYVTDEVVSWVQGNPQWKAVRGVGQDELKDTGKDSVEKTLPAEIRATKALRAVRPSGWRVYWWKVDGSYFRHAAHAALLRTPDQYGSGMIPAGLKQTDGLIQHLCGEVWMPPTVKDGKAVAGYWARHGKRWDLLDCLVYALALGLLHRYLPDRRDDSDEPTPPPTPSPPGGWVDASYEPGSSWV